MATSEKQQLVGEIKERLQSSGGLIMADYRGLSVKAMQGLRGRLRDAGAEITVYKNSLTEIAVRELDMPSMGEYLEGPTALVFTPEDPVASAKAMMEFAKDNKVFAVKGGYIDGTLVSADQIKAIASLPSREELIAKIMGSMLNPVRGFMAMANAPAGALARALQHSPDIELIFVTAFDQFAVEAGMREGRVGVWVERKGAGWSREDKIAAIGVKVRKWVSFHGISLNVEPDLDHFGGIVPCGITEHGVTSLVDLGVLATMDEADGALKASFQRVFGAVQDGEPPL